MKKLYTKPFVKKEDMLFIDTETTFPQSNDIGRKVVEIAIFNGYGVPIYINIFNPGIETDDQFAHKGLNSELLWLGSNFDAEWLKIKNLITGKHLVAWWMDNERNFYPDQLNCATTLHCAQNRFSPLIGEYSIKYANYRSVGLWDAHKFLKLKQPYGKQHRAATDVLAMIDIWYWLDKYQYRNINFEQLELPLH